MRMVASAKLHHAQGMTEKFLRYKDCLQSMMERLGGIQTTASSTDDVHSVVLIPVSSNSGLCGAFNSNIAKATLMRIHELESKGKKVRLMPIGKKIAHELQAKGFDCNIGYFNLLDHIEKRGIFAEVAYLVEFALQLRQNGEIDRVEFIYHHFKSMGSQVIQIDSLQLTVDSSMRQGESQPSIDDPQSSTVNSQLSTYLTEPTPQELLSTLFPRMLNAQAYGILLDSLTSEHAARMLAMQTADDNANDLLKDLTLLYNKTRQQAITNELIDIMSGQAGKH